jgi:hypothetical protein
MTHLKTAPMAFVAGLFILAEMLGGCGSSLSYTVPPDLIQRLPKSSRRSVFQARTVVTIAIDRKSAIKRKIDSSHREIERTHEKIKAAEKERDAASAREADKLDMEVDMLHAKIDYLHEVIDHQEYRAELAEKELLLAKAQFELSKVKLVKKHSIAFGGDEEDFVEQVESLQEEVDDFRKDVEEDAADLKAEEEHWQAIKKKYYSSIGESSKGWWTE